MQHFFVKISIAVAILLMMSCEKEVSLDLKADEDKIVIEGNIENNAYPIVRLSKTIGFFSSISYEQVAKAVVRGASVSVSDGVTEIFLKEYAVPVGDFTLYYYSIDNANPTHLSFKGQIGKEYRLTVKHEDKVYTANTSIPALNEGVDSIYHERFQFDDADSSLKDKRNVIVSYQDPPEAGNFVRFFVSNDGFVYDAPRFSLLNDQITNGIKYPVNIFPPSSPFDTTSFANRDLYEVGDTVRIKWCAINRDAYEFYNTLNFSQNSVGNPFSAPVQVTSNIKGGALGVWVGYGAKYYTYIIEE